MAEASLLSSPFPSGPERCLFLSSQLPHNTEASGEKREITLNGATWRPKAPETQKQLLLDVFFGSNSYPFMIYFSKWLIWLKIFRQSPFLQWSLSHSQLIKVMLSSQKCWVFLSHNDTEKMKCVGLREEIPSILEGTANDDLPGSSTNRLNLCPHTWGTYHRGMRTPLTKA